MRRDFGRALMNGSLIGWNPFSMSIGGDFEIPQQQFYILDRKYGKTAVWPIIVGENQNAMMVAA
jgi:hypothetical protein